MSTTSDYEAFVVQFEQACERHARADAERKRLEDIGKIAFSHMASQYINEGMAIAKAEHRARCSDYVIEKVKELAEAQLEANLAYATVKSMELRFEMFRSRNANRRAEMNLGRV